MSVYELNRDQMVTLKQRYLDNHLIEVENRTASWGELAMADSIISDDDIYNNYGCYDFVEEDF